MGLAGEVGWVVGAGWWRKARLLAKGRQMERRGRLPFVGFWVVIVIVAKKDINRYRSVVFLQQNGEAGKVERAI